MNNKTKIENLVQAQVHNPGVADDIAIAAIIGDNGIAGSDIEGNGSTALNAAKAALMVGRGEIGKFGTNVPETPDGVIMSGAIDNVGCDIENFTNANPAAMMVVNFEANNNEVKQDPSLNPFFRTVELDPTISEYHLILSTKYIKSTGLRLPGSKEGFSTPIIKELFNIYGVLGRNDLQLTPIWDADTPVNDRVINDDFLETVVIGETDETVETGPIKLNIMADIIGASQTPAMITNGIFDTNTVLSGLPVTKAVAFTITTKDDDDNDVLDKIKFDISAFDESLWQAKHGGDDQSLLTSFSKIITVNLNTVKSYKDEATNLSTLDSRFKVQFELILNGMGNLRTGLRITGVQTEFKQILDLDGNKVPDNTDDSKIKDAIDSLVAGGVYYEAFIPNATLEKTGLNITTKRYGTRYGIAPMNPMSIENPLDGASLLPSDGVQLNDVSMVGASVSTIQGLIKLNDKVIDLKSKTNGGVNLSEVGISFPLSTVVDPYFVSKTFEIGSYLDAQNSMQKREALMSSLGDFLAMTFGRMIRSTRYEQVASNEKISFRPSIMVPPVLFDIIGEKLTVGNYEVTLVTNPSNIIETRILMAIEPVRKDASTDAFGFGIFVVSPTLVTEVKDNIKILTVTPFGKYHVTLPILAEIEMPDIGDFIKKNTSNVQQV